MDNTHRIHRIRCQARAEDQTTAFALRQRLRSELQDPLPQLLNDIFDAACPPNQIIRIPKLDIQLKLSPDQNWSQALADEVLLQLAELLRTEQNSSTAIDDDTHTAHPPLQRRDLSQNRRQLLLSYLQTGQLAFAHYPGTDEALQQALKQEALQWLQHNWADLLRHLPADFASAYLACWRYLQLLSDAEIASIHFQLPRIALAVPLTSPQLTVSQAQAQLPALLYQLWLEHQLSPVFTPQNLRPMLAVLLLWSDGRWQGKDLPIRQAVVLLQHATQYLPIRQGLKPAVQRCLTVLAGMLTRVERDQPLHLWQQDSLRPTATPTEQTRYLSHEGGLILLHGFLPRLFAACQLLTPDQKQLLPSELTRAAALLHYLVYGEQAVQEYQLNLSKVLLGLEPTQVLISDLALLNESDKQEAHSLLNAVIGHWKALGNTSVAGLQRTFLQRKALLYRHPQYWQLQLESAAFDVLLAQLPWGFSLIKLPWMQQRMITEWNHA